MRKAFYVLIHDCFFLISCILHSLPGWSLEKQKLGLVSVSPSVSVTLVSTLATVSVHFCLCHLGLHTCHSVSPLLSVSPWSPHLLHCTVSVHFCLYRLGLHTCHSVSPLLSLSPWSPLLPQCQSTASSSVSVTVRVVILTAPLNESIVNGYRRHSQNSCSCLLPQGLNPNPQVNTCLQSLGLRCSCCFLPQLGLPVNSRGEGPRSLGESPIGRLGH